MIGNDRVHMNIASPWRVGYCRVPSIALHEFLYVCGCGFFFQVFVWVLAQRVRRVMMSGYGMDSS